MTCDRDNKQVINDRRIRAGTHTGMRAHNKETQRQSQNGTLGCSPISPYPPGSQVKKMVRVCDWFGVMTELMTCLFNKKLRFFTC